MPAQSWNQVLVVAQSAGSALTAAARASALPAQAKITLPAGFFDGPGKTIRVKASGKITSLITTPGTARYDISFGSNVVFDGLAVLLDSVAAHTNVGWDFEATLTCQTVGTSATLIGVGRWTSEDILGVPATAPKGVLSAMLPWNSTPAAGATFDSNASQVIDFFFTQTAATGSMTLLTYSVESLN